VVRERRLGGASWPRPAYRQLLELPYYTASSKTAHARIELARSSST